MAKRKDEEQNAAQLLFQGGIVELTPTAAYSYTILETEAYESWIDSISDLKTNTRITSNVDKMRRGLFGDWKDVSDGIFEMRLDFGPGYRVYYSRHEKVVLILLGGGDKNSQRKDIAAAQKLWERLKDEIKEI